MDILRLSSSACKHNRRCFAAIKRVCRYDAGVLGPNWFWGYARFGRMLSHKISLRRIQRAENRRTLSTCLASCFALTAGTTTKIPDDEASCTIEFSEKAVAKLVAIVGDGALSPLGQATWEEVIQHTAQRLEWINGGYELLVINDRALLSTQPEESFERALQAADILLVVCVKNDVSVRWIMNQWGQVRTVVCFDSSSKLQTKLGGNEVMLKDPLNRLRATLPGSQMSEHLKVLNIVEEAWRRQSSDDIRFVLLLLINAYVCPVESLKNLRATDLDTLKCMITNCGPQILDCLLDPNCRNALSCLTSCAPCDQVCSYRCIASYESPQLEAFSLCILQKYNCLGLNAEIPMQPDVQSLGVFRGQPLSHDLAEDIFIGWLGKLPWSWRVAAGQNPAYDHFPCQLQLFYRGRSKGSMWYDPVFQVNTLDGRLLWRRRHYRVKRSDRPGTFFFTVLDNGVVSREFWRIVDATDDLAWGLFFYSGAAEVVGQSYTGAVLVTPDGLWPADRESERLTFALENCGIKDWEMYKVNNRSCQNPPLDIPEDAKLHRTSFWNDET